MGGSTPWDILLYYIGGGSKEIVTASSTLKTPVKTETASTRNYALFMNIQQYVNLPFEINNTNMLAITLIAQTLFWLFSFIKSRKEKQLIAATIT